jgi:hypothetical protein
VKVVSFNLGQINEEKIKEFIIQAFKDENICK